MVDQTNLNKVMMLNGELQVIASALDIFDHYGGRIVNMTVASAMDQEPARQITVQTATMAYPPQMVEAIKIYLDEREEDIRKELASLGVTGVTAEVRR